MSIKRLSGAGLTTPKSNKLWDQVTVMGPFEAIQTIEVPSAGSSSISFTSIPQDYRDLKILMRSSTGAEINNKIEFNSDTTSTNYYYAGLEGNGAGTGSSAYVISGNTNYVGYDNSTGITDFCHSIIDIKDYSVASKKRLAYTRTGFERSAPAGTVGFYSCYWHASTNAITTITIKPTSGNWKQYSHFALYGIRG